MYRWLRIAGPARTTRCELDDGSSSSSVSASRLLLAAAAFLPRTHDSYLRMLGKVGSHSGPCPTADLPLSGREECSVTVFWTTGTAQLALDTTYVALFIPPFFVTIGFPHLNKTLFPHGHRFPGSCELECLSLRLGRYAACDMYSSDRRAVPTRRSSAGNHGSSHMF